MVQGKNKMSRRRNVLEKKADFGAAVGDIYLGHTLLMKKLLTKVHPHV